MARPLSSQWTFFYKYVLTVLWTGGFGIVTLIEFVAPGAINLGGNPEDQKWVFLFAWAVLSVLFYWGFARLKKVELDGDTLLVSNYRKGIRVSLRDVASVSGSILQTPELVWLHFRRPTEFGTRIVFMGQVRWLSSQLSKHPVVEELRELIARANANASF